MSTWQAASLRLTVFPQLDASVDPSGWWMSFIGYPPETVISRPKAAQHQQEGVFEGKKLTLQVQPERIDWTLAAPIENSREVPEMLLVAGPFPEALKPFLMVTVPWLEVCPPITRIAFGAVLAQPVADREAGYIQIAKYLPSVALDPQGSSDFFYQMNRPRNSTSGIAGLRINRLTKWSVLLFQTVGVSLGKTEPRTVRYTAQQSACRLELDISTVPDFPGLLPHEALPKLLRELTDLGQEIAARGDTP